MIFIAFLVVFGIYGCERSGEASPSPVVADNKAEKAVSSTPIEDNKKEAVVPVAPAARKKVFRSPLMGTWYTDDASALRSQIEGFWEKANVSPVENILALILPHAGYQYSGQTAAYGLKSLKKKYKRIVIIGPSHRVAMYDTFWIPNVTHYQTPLGEIAVDLAFIEELKQHSVFVTNPTLDQLEHSVHIQMPVLQYCQKDALIVPLVAGNCSYPVIKKIASILKGLMDQDTLMLISSDFVHYGPNYRYTPFTKDIPEGIKQLNEQAMSFIKEVNPKAFLEFCQKSGATICGQIPIALLLEMLPVNAHGKLLYEESSGNLMKDFTNSVSYLTIAFSGTWQQEPKIQPQKKEGNLTAEEKKLLLTIARKSLLYFIQNDRIPELSDLGISKLTPALQAPAATFVTLKKKFDLRGCIGEVFAVQPLFKSVLYNSIRSGLYDRRFQPVTLEECQEITIKISVLTAPMAVPGYQDIKIGTDGIILKKAGHSALFLPEVATEQGWNIEQTLTYLSAKAGLPQDAWKEDADFETFQSIGFGEDDK